MKPSPRPSRILPPATPVVLKILSPDIVHKSEVGGVRLGLITEQDVRRAATEILDRARAAKPGARIDGVTVFPMIVRPKARELIVGLADDPTFGPVIVFGQGGTAVEVIDDKALALPPLDLALARDLIGRTRVSRILKAYRNVPAADEHAIALLLVKLAQLAADFSEIREIDLNPVLADETGVIAVDARVSIAPAERRRARTFGRFAIRPYPKEWERHLTLPDGTQASGPAGPAGRRSLVSAVFRRRHAGGFAPAVFRSGEGIQPCFHRALHPDRLRPRHGFYRHRRGERRHARRGAHPRRSQFRNRGIRHPRSAPI